MPMKGPDFTKEFGPGDLVDGYAGDLPALLVHLGVRDGADALVGGEFEALALRDPALAATYARNKAERKRRKAVLQTRLLSPPGDAMRPPVLHFALNDYGESDVIRKNARYVIGTKKEQKTSFGGYYATQSDFSPVSYTETVQLYANEGGTDAGHDKYRNPYGSVLRWLYRNRNPLHERVQFWRVKTYYSRRTDERVQECLPCDAPWVTSPSAWLGYRPRSISDE